MSWRHRLCPPMRACARIGAAVLFVLCVAPRAHADSAPDGPMWLRAPRERGPLAGTLAYDGRSSWGLDAAIPLGRIAGVHEPPRVPRLALGLSMSGLTNGATYTLANQFMLAAYQCKVDFMNQIAHARGLEK